MLRSLKVQIIIALALMLGMFITAMLFTQQVVNRQHQDDRLLRLAAQLQLSEQQMVMQAMHYKDNAPRDYPTYYRDLELYFRDLQDHRERFARIVKAFAAGDFGDDMAMPYQITLDPATRLASAQLEIAWQRFDQVLAEKLGQDIIGPRLEWAATWILDGHTDFAAAVSDLIGTLQRRTEHHSEQASLIWRVSLVSILLGAALIIGWFVLRVLRPLHHAVEGFHQVADGDFSTRLKTSATDEIGALTADFNLLADRMQALLQLITSMQQQPDLQQGLEQTAQLLPRLLPLDWCGLLVQGVDGQFQLQASVALRGHIRAPYQLLALPSECIGRADPVWQIKLEVPSNQPLEHFLQQMRLHDALALSLKLSETRTALLLLATLETTKYRANEQRLLRNLAPLLSASLGRSVVLAESLRLATIGEFASAIVHELRSPVGTIGMALEHLSNKQAVDPSSAKRLALAVQEQTRLRRLLDEVLLYAKPMQLRLAAAQFADLLRLPALASFVDQAHVDLESITGLPSLQLDQDRIQQLLINLLDNALAANGDDPLGVHLSAKQSGNWVEISIRNGGTALREDQLLRAFEPFYTTKRGGTGLGLAISQRIAEAHGGEVKLLSLENNGTEVQVRLPVQEGA